MRFKALMLAPVLLVGLAACDKHDAPAPAKTEAPAAAPAAPAAEPPAAAPADSTATPAPAPSDATP
ncbi:hypothetical protein VPG91_17950, partial [Nitrospirillum amazonense]